jgi:hypothetical protein
MPPPSPPPHAACTMPAPPGPRSFSERASPRPRRQARVAIPPPIRNESTAMPTPPFHRMRSLKLRAPDHATAQSTAAPIPPHALAEASRSGPCHRPFHRYAACRDAARRLHDSLATRTAKLQRAHATKAASPRPRRHTAANLDHATAQSAIPPHALAEASRSGPCRRPCHRSVPPPFRRMRSLKLRAPDHATAMPPLLRRLPAACCTIPAPPGPRSFSERTPPRPPPAIPPHALAEASRSGPCHRPVHRYAACRDAACRLHDSRATRTAKLQRARVAKAASPRPRRHTAAQPDHATAQSHRPHSTACAR